MKAEPCPFEQCKFSQVCNHIHCIRPHCSYVLHSSGQLFSHKRKHERHDSELAYRKYKSAGTIGGARPSGSWPPDEMPPNQSLSMTLNGESSNDDRCSPSFYSSIDDSFQSGGGNDSAMDLTAPTTTAMTTTTTITNMSMAMGDNRATITFEQPHQQQQLSQAELACLLPASIDCPCQTGRDHFHCALGRCGTSLRDVRDVKEHLHEHETQEKITNAFFEEGGCDESCAYYDKEKHYHCNWENCREVILATDKPFRRLQHYKIHEYSKQLNLTSSNHALSSDMTLTHLTNIDAMFRRKRGRPPKNRVIEIWSSSGDPTSHTQDSPQAIFTSFKLPKPQTPTTSLPSLMMMEEREGSVSPSNSIGGDTEGFATYNPDNCPEITCALRSRKHHHCSQPRCHFSTDRADQLLMHSKDFHDNIDIPLGFAFYDKMIDCRLPGCHSNMINRHFHCTRPSCGYSFVRYSAIGAHEDQHASSMDFALHEAALNEAKSIIPQVTIQECKPRIQVKNPAELIDKPDLCIDDSRQIIDDGEHDISSPDASKTTGELNEYNYSF